jgi:hypothetical protein
VRRRKTETEKSKGKELPQPLQALSAIAKAAASRTALCSTSQQPAPHEEKLRQSSAPVQKEKPQNAVKVHAVIL